MSSRTVKTLKKRMARSSYELWKASDPPAKLTMKVLQDALTILKAAGVGKR